MLLPVSIQSQSTMGMNVNLTPQLEELVRSKVASGLYTSASEVVREALRLMDEQDRLREAKLEQLRSDIRQGLAKYSARCRRSRRGNTAWSGCGKVEWGAAEDRFGNGAHCPRVSVVMGDVIDIGESAGQFAAVVPISRLRE